jgi:hypothetical protein
MRLFFWINLLILLLLTSCKESSIKCDHETRSHDLLFFKSGSEIFLGGSSQDSTFSYEGKYASKVAPASWGTGYIIKEFDIDQHLVISVWALGENAAIVLKSGGKVIDRSEKGYKRKNGWRQIVLDTYINPLIDKSKTLKVQVYNFGSEVVFADNFEISIEDQTFADYNNLPLLKIQVSDSGLLDLKNERLVSFENLVQVKHKWQDFTMYSDHKKWSGKIRLKGDMTDHLMGKKWSFRIKLDSAFRGMKEFSLMSPKARDFMNEWLFHHVCEAEGIMTTSYDFIPLSFQGESLGIYAIEEHFGPGLLVNNDRLDGPILKYDDAPFLSQRKQELENRQVISRPYFEAAVITSFDKKRIKKENKFKDQFLKAQNLLLKHKMGLNEVSDVFDEAYLAKYYAIVFGMKALHGFIWHDQNFYYNSGTQKLENIAYDAFSQYGPEINSHDPALQIPCKAELTDPKDVPGFYLMSDSSFYALYEKNLKDFTKSLSQFIGANEKELKALETLINSEFKYYEFDKAFWHKRIKTLENKQENNCIPDFEIVPREYEITRELDLAVSINIYYDHLSGTYSFQNYHTDSVSIIGLGSKKEIEFNLNLKLPGFPADIEVTGLQFHKYCYFKYKNETYKKKLNWWPPPQINYGRSIEKQI